MPDRVEGVGLGTSFDERMFSEPLQTELIFLGQPFLKKSNIRRASESNRFRGSSLLDFLHLGG
jgi:hypothetical protein